MIREYKYGDSTQLSKHFRACEFQCKCSGKHSFKLDDELVEKLELFYTKIPELYGIKVKSINVSSGFRCVSHDKAVGGSGTGQHTLGRAADYSIICEDGNPLASWKVCIAAQEIGFRGIARINDGWTHSDTRNGKWYGDETRGNSYCIPCNDFYDYFNYGKEAEPMTNGIDVSAHQGKIDWSKVKTDFAILRAGYGKCISQKDEQLEANYAGAKVAGIPVGAYWYSYAMTPEEAKQEADVFLEVLKGKQWEFPVFLDLEEQKQLALGKDKVSAIIAAFLERVESAGYWVGLYMSASPLTSLVTDTIKKRYSVWVANVGVSKPAYSGSYGLWQYSWKGKISGINGDVDLDYAYVDYPSQIKSKGLNGFGVTHPPDEPEKEDEIPFEMVFGGQKYAGTLKKV